VHQVGVECCRGTTGPSAVRLRGRVAGSEKRQARQGLFRGSFVPILHATVSEECNGDDENEPEGASDCPTDDGSDIDC